MEAGALSTATGRRPRIPLPYSRLGDERLARLLGDGDDRAFAAIYDRYHQPLYRLCRSILREDADAQDALQTALASALSALRAGRRDAPLRPWLFRIAHNAAVSVLRRRRPQDELSDALVSPAAGVPDHAAERERLSTLLEDLHELPERQRGALVMRELSGLSHEEIASAFQTSVGTAKQAIFEARRALAEFEEGRQMICAEICRTISDGDGRALRGRRVRGHLRGCSSCAAFATAIPSRSADLRALTPALPAGSAGLLLTRLIKGGSGIGGGGASSAGVSAGVAGKAAASLSAAKLATGLAIVATGAVGVTGIVARGHFVPPRSATPGAHPPRGAGESAGSGRTRAGGAVAAGAAATAGSRAGKAAAVAAQGRSAAKAGARSGRAGVTAGARPAASGVAPLALPGASSLAPGHAGVTPASRAGGPGGHGAGSAATKTGRGSSAATARGKAEGSSSSHARSGPRHTSPAARPETTRTHRTAGSNRRTSTPAATALGTGRGASGAPGTGSRSAAGTKGEQTSSPTSTTSAASSPGLAAGRASLRN